MKLNTLCLYALALAVLVSVRGYAQQGGRDIAAYELNATDSTYTSISFTSAAGWSMDQAQKIFDRYAGAQGSTLVLASTVTTPLGLRTDRYVQYYQGVKVEFSSFAITGKADAVNFVTANYYKMPAGQSAQSSLTEAAALTKALAHVGAGRYMWQDGGRERMLQQMTGRADTSYYPKGSMVWVEDMLTEANTRTLHLAYAFDIYAAEPLSRDMVYVDAATGRILAMNPLIKNTAANGPSLYSGNVGFQAAASGSTYVLQDATRGSGINTYNCNNGDGSVANDFTSASPTFASNAALDAHWGAEKVYDYWRNVQGRNSYNNAGGAINSFVHYMTGYDNAFWDGYEMVYGDGTGIAAGGFSPLVSLDVCAHEIGHAVCQYTANLVYEKEAGAMNEGFSDIWGAVIENYANPNEVDAVAKNKWAIGEEISASSLRRMDNPNLRGQPDTYGGSYWYSVASCTPSSSNDYCGVHRNSGVLNYWFYLLAQGGSGTNDLGNTFSVSTIGITKAAAIVYQTELMLTSTATYASCRTASINAATALYGACSAEVESVTRAWYAVGVGANYTSAALASITGASAVCAGSTTAFAIAATGGTWSSSNASIAAVTTGGMVSGISAGVATISYNTGGCYSTRSITVNALPSAGTLSGSSTVAVGSSLVLSPSVVGGAWSSANAAIATVNTAGSVTGMSAGTVNISYAVSNTCGSAYAIKTITVSVANAAPVFTGGATQSLVICQNAAARSVNAMMAVSDINAGQTETWTVTAAPAHGTVAGFSTSMVATGGTITPGGLTYTPAAGYSGTDAFTVRVSDGSATATTTINVTISALPVAPVISGASTLAVGGSASLTASVIGGVWSVSNAAIAAVNASGMVTGISAGTATVTYAISNTCGSAYATKAITVSSANVAPVFTSGTSQSMTVCQNAAATSINAMMAVSDANAGQTETWTVSVAPVHGTLSGFAASITATGGTVIPAGLTYTPAAGYSGTDVFTVRVSDGTATATTTVNVTINTLPTTPAITGAASVAVGSTAGLTASVGGGVWSVNNAAIATISSTGVVTGRAAGTATVTYAISNPCGSTYATKLITVTAANSTPVFTGGASQSLSICRNTVASINALMTIMDANAGQTETWSVATAPSHGTLSGFSASAVSTGGIMSRSGLTYTPAAGYIGTDVFVIRISDGIVSSTTTVTINVAGAANAGTLYGSANVYVGSAITLGSTVTGGIWTSGNVAVATVGTSSGVVTGVAAGTVLISYTVSNACGTATATGKIRVRRATAGMDSEDDTTTLATAVNEVRAAEVTMFPNPTSGSFTFRTSEAGKLQVYNIQGLLVGEYIVIAGDNSLALSSNLATGFYIGRFTGEDNSTASVRISLQK